MLGLLLAFSSNAANGFSDGPVRFTGAFMQGGLVIGKTEPGSEVYFEGNRIRISDEGLFVFGFSRDAGNTAELEILLPDGNRLVETLVVSAQDYDIERIEGLPPCPAHAFDVAIVRVEY